MSITQKNVLLLHQQCFFYPQNRVQFSFLYPPEKAVMAQGYVIKLNFSMKIRKVTSHNFKISHILHVNQTKSNHLHNIGKFHDEFFVRKNIRMLRWRRKKLPDVRWFQSRIIWHRYCVVYCNYSNICIEFCFTIISICFQNKNSLQNRKSKTN